jgi:hypothetical protein
MRVVSFVSAALTLTCVVVYLSGHHSWRAALIAAVVANFGIFTALVIRTLILRERTRATPKS